MHFMIWEICLVSGLARWDRFSGRLALRRCCRGHVPTQDRRARGQPCGARGAKHSLQTYRVDMLRPSARCCGIRAESDRATGCPPTRADDSEGHPASAAPGYQRLPSAPGSSHVPSLLATRLSARNSGGRSVSCGQALRPRPSGQRRPRPGAVVLMPAVQMDFKKLAATNFDADSH